MNSPSIAPLLAGHALESNSFVVAEWQDSGQSSEARPIAPLHVHHQDDEGWYVLEGTLGVRRGEEQIEANAGAAVIVPRGMSHTYWNAGPGRLRYLLVMTANIYGLITAIHAMTDRNPTALKTLFAKHNSELL